MLFAARAEVCTDLLVDPPDLVERGGTGDDHVRGDKPLGAGDLECPGNEKRLAAPVLAPDKLDIPAALRDVIELFSYYALF